ncbi:MATE efflux family protein [Basidiobolus meristosporus CBS 931.73]|uniref:MATE efflux family protein n=1 Tax=Basidiobolus meristosporus CBS 931.73 TaxID=1314790 RepID=A0A1Y1Z9I9_9FUNG|nr:MATE efflux family protein [Basidiobolus meristosporus CBS 931.73]|eukprot:ORY06445.1 MATE efflux family protein [Basidiobolus meristosporus CBS 931.73]
MGFGLGERATCPDYILEPAQESLDQPLLSIKEEGIELVKMAMPLVVSYLLQYVINLAGIVILGRMGAEELGAATLASMFSTLTAFSPGIGLATALDTLCSQAYTGAHDVTIIGVYLQRAILFMSALWGGLGLVWFNAEWIFVNIMRQDPHLARLASIYLQWLWPGMLPVLLFESIKRYLQAQGIMNASTIILGLVTPFTFLLTYLLVFWPPTAIGFIGAPIAYSISYTIVLLMIIGYVRFVDGSEAWGGWSRKCLEGWGTFARLALPSVIVISAEFCAWELVTLATTFFGITALAAQSVLITTDACLYQITLGWGVASSIRVGHYLGGNLPLHAKRAAYAATYISLLMGSFNAIILIVFKSHWAYIFINDVDVIKLVATITPILAVCQMCDVVGNVSGGILRGQGRPSIGAFFNLVGYYVIAAPLGGILAFKFNMGLQGLWLSLSVALIVLTLGQCIIGVYMADWDLIAVASRRQFIQREGDDADNGPLVPQPTKETISPD